jgi:hypothetical protein
MNPIQPLNLPKTNLNLSKKGDKIFVFCLIRRKHILLTPEEWVRQHFIAYLNNVLGHPIEAISIEKSLNYFGMTKRWDIVVYNSEFNPNILIECKAPQVTLGENTLGQVLSYQNQLQCEFIGITNGINHFFWQVSDSERKIMAITELPIKRKINLD